MIRVVQAGYGRFGRIYAARLRDHSEFDLVGVTDPNADALRDACEDGFATMPTLRSAITLAAPDVVLIAASEHEHARLAFEALSLGRHVIVAKPGATSIVDAEQIRTLARTNGACVYVDWTLLYSRGWDRVFSEHLKLGPVRTVRMTRRGSSVPRACGVVWDLAPHDVAMTWRLRGGSDPVRCVTTHEWGTGAYIGLTHASGSTTRIEVDYAATERERRLDITCRDGSISWDQVDDVITIASSSSTNARTIQTLSTPDAITNHLSEIARILGDPAQDDADQLVDVTRILEAATHPGASA